jgi:DNA adenine methylase
MYSHDNIKSGLKCKFCGTTSEEDYFEYDKFNRGFWCEVCDGFNYLNEKDENKHKFYLVLEDKAKGNNIKVKLDIKFKKQISPLRYPGGKTKLIDYVYSKLNLSKADVFVEPFAGGASVGLSLLDAGVIDKLILNDLDFGVYSLFSMIKNSPDKLIRKINNHIPTHNDYFKTQQVIKSNYKDCNEFEAAWSLLVVNRLAYSGICKAGPLGGKNGSINDLLIRWNPKTLTKRINKINKMSGKITVLNVDAFELIEEMYWNESATIFIDPPYFRKGKDLYNCYFDKNDHIKLNVLLDNLYQGMPGADLILTYDNDEFIERLYFYPDVEKVKRVYSI